MNLFLAIYDSTQSLEDTFWRFRHPKIPIESLDCLYKWISLNGDNAKLSDIGMSQYRTGVAVCDARWGFLYRVYATRTPRYETIVFALGFNTQEVKGLDILKAWDKISELDGYIISFLREDGTIRTPLQSIKALEFSASVPTLFPLVQKSSFSLHVSQLNEMQSKSIVSFQASDILQHLLTEFISNHFFIASIHRADACYTVHYVLAKKALSTQPADKMMTDGNPQLHIYESSKRRNPYFDWVWKYPTLGLKYRYAIIVIVVFLIGGSLSYLIPSTHTRRIALRDPSSVIVDVKNNPQPLPKERIYLGDSSVGSHRCTQNH